MASTMVWRWMKVALSGGLQHALADRLRHLDEIAEHRVVLDLEAAGVGQVAIARLERGDDLPALVAQRQQLVEAGIVAAPDEAAVAALQRQGVRQGRGEHGGQRRVRRRRRGAGCDEERGRRPLRKAIVVEELGKGAGHLQTLRERLEVARAGAVERHARQGAREVGRRLEERARLHPQRAVLDEEAHAVEPRLDGGAIGQRVRQLTGQQAAAGRRDAAVDRGEQRALARAGERAREFEVGARRRVHLHVTGALRAARGMEVRPGPALCALEVEHRGRGGADLRRAERAEPVEGGEAEEVEQPALRRTRLAAELRQRRLGVGEQPGDLRQRGDRLRYHDLARVDAADLAGETEQGDLTDLECAGRDVDRRQTVQPRPLRP